MTDTQNKTETTTVQEVEMDLNDILGTPGAENIMLPEEKKSTVFTSKKVDTSFLDKEDDESSNDDKPSRPEVAIEALNDIVNEKILKLLQ